MEKQKDEDGHMIYTYKSKDLDWDVIVGLSQYWSLLITYRLPGECPEFAEHPDCNSHQECDGNCSGSN